MADQAKIVEITKPHAASPRRPHYSETDDDDLIRLTRGGARDAFDVLVRRHQEEVLRTAAKLLGDSTAAKDAAQNTFLEVYRYLPRYQPQGKFRPFLHRVLLNQCRLLQRSAGYASRTRERLAVLPPGGQSLPDDQILRQERAREIERALQKLSHRLRVVLVMRYAGGLTYHEIAEALSLPIGTVKSRLSTGVEKLRRIVEGEER